MSLATYTNRLTARVLRDHSDLECIVPEWHRLFDICDATVFQSPDWLLPWIEVFSPGDLIVVEVRDVDRLVGLAPLLIYPRGHERILAFAGGGVSDYLDILAEPKTRDAVIDLIFRAVNSAPDWATLDLTDLPGGSATLQVSGFRQYAQEHDCCSVLELPSSKQELLQVFSNRQRANLRNSRSRLQRVGGGRVEIASPETLPDFLSDLFRLHTIRWSVAGESGVLSDESTRQFHRVSAPRLLAAGLLRVYRLRIETNTVAVIYALTQRDTLYCYLQGFDPAFSFFSPGTYLMFSVLEDAVERGMRRFDFLRGQEAYKQHWRPRAEATYRVEMPRSALDQIARAVPASHEGA